MVDQPVAIVSREEVKGRSGVQNIIDFNEEKYKTSLESYNKLLVEIAKTGSNPYTWKEIKKFICYKSEAVLVHD